ncbi:MAG TPA: peptidoglycan editing factor PgeF [Candidatus Intestinimonas pullistercoris]|uniref:Purine nucleoside phosphorylase n=1 Tax=Candidatus Intestinimonas pullistercoris TaxID=2838623 RepID=A0A9D2P1W8_9FIRM|nr:peptidoglycan editing factor PgeF [uncultured Intestinimonas sp.]HJC41771.1 peptidoglycan editing factor PgeF [Candidatus Intestinimonas pullistercoris]
MEIKDRIQNGVTYLAADGLEAAGGVVHGFSTRLGGVSTGIYASMDLGTTRGDDSEHVRENYRRFLAAIGAAPDRIAMSNQVHSDVVRPVTVSDIKKDLYDQEPYEADGLVTDIPGVALVIFSADCLPVLLYDPVRHVAAAAHAGWRGTASGIVERAVEKMAFYGSRPEDILAAIGPGISKCCFETHEDVPNAMTAALGVRATPFITPIQHGKFLVDLKGINAMRLERAGLAPEHIAVSGDCTACQPDKYWSHRVTQGVRGSQAAVIQLL